MAGVTGALILRHFGGRFHWAERDCCVSACNAWAELWGFDPMAAWRGRYADEASARALIAENGGLRIMATLTFARAGLAWRRQAREGDVALLDVAGKPALGLAIGDGRFVGKGALGPAFLGQADGAWGLR